MPGASLHLTHAELMAGDVRLHPLFQEAMAQELLYMRMGAILPDLPFYHNIITLILGYWLELPAEQCPFAVQIHRHHPDLFAWHFIRSARQVEGDLTENQRRALLAGFLCHVALDIELHPLVNWCARRDQARYGGVETHHHRLTEKYHSLFIHRRLVGDDVLGKRQFFTERTQIIDVPAAWHVSARHPAVTWSCDMFAGFYQQNPPSPRQFAHWIRSFRHFALAVSLPIAGRNSQQLGNEENYRRYFENQDFSFMEFWERAYERTVSLLNLAAAALEEDSWDASTRGAFLREAKITDLACPPERHLPAIVDHAGLELGCKVTG